MRLLPALTPLLAAAVLAAPAPTAPGFDVAGSVALSGEEELEVSVDLTNRGNAPAGDVAVLGELAGHYDEAQVAAGIAPGRTGTARLRFPRQVPRPGVYALVLRLDYAPQTPAAGGPAALSQRAFLLLSLGASAPPAVRLSAPAVVLADRVPLPVALESADGAAHRVRLTQTHLTRDRLSCSRL